MIEHSGLDAKYESHPPRKGKRNHAPCGKKPAASAFSYYDSPPKRESIYPRRGLNSDHGWLSYVRSNQVDHTHQARRRGPCLAG
ncbi:hypothetical protein E4T43_07069 [Aureobasidium subglaciale]|nr:hypothetical protein E4T43_07069 [Aureobasidium subglaciale]